MKSLNSKVKEFFDFQAWKLFISLDSPKVYEDFVCMFYANLRYPKSDRIVSLVLGQRIVLDYSTFDSMFQCKCSGYSAQFRSCWPDDFKVSFDQDKRCIAEPLYDSLPKQFGPGNINYENRVLAHIVSTTILPRTRSFSTLSQKDTFLVYWILTKYKVKLSSCVINFMIESSDDPSRLPYGMIITRLLEAHNISLSNYLCVTISNAIIREPLSV